MNTTALKYVRIISRWLFIMCIPLFLLTSVIAVAINSQWLYGHISTPTACRKRPASKSRTGEGGNADNPPISIHPKSIYPLSLSKTAPTSCFSMKRSSSHEGCQSAGEAGLLCLAGHWAFMLFYSVLNIFYLRRACYRPLASAVFRGGSITIGLILILGIIAVADFDVFLPLFT